MILSEKTDPKAFQTPSCCLRMVAPYTIVPGMPLTYTLLVENIGAADIYDIEVRDTPASNTSPPPAFISDTGIFEGNTTLVWALDVLPAGVTRVLTWRGTVASDISATTLANRATASAANGLTATGEVISFVDRPHLTLYKSATPSALPGETLAYTLTLANDGDVPAFNVSLSDPLPDAVISPTAISGGGTLQQGEIIWQFDTLSAGGSRTLSWRGTLDPQLDPAARAVENIATVTAAGNITADARAAILIPLRKITLTKMAPSGTNPGDRLTYTLIAQNAGETTLRGLQLVDILPQYLTPLAITNTARIVSAADISATATVSTALLAPVLHLRKSAPAAV